MKTVIKLSIVLCICLLVGYDSQAQCAMCRATVETNLSEGRGVIGTGINFGILYLLSAPYLLVAGLIFLWYRVGKKELKAKTELQNQLNAIYKK
jgi:hypothetical protein